MNRTVNAPLSVQMTRRIKAQGGTKNDELIKGDISLMTSTGSTLLDLAISGGRVKGGGIPAGILVEVFGPSSSGKTVLLCEIAGYIQRAGGGILFFDPEARLNSQFAALFDLDTHNIEYSTPDTVTSVMEGVKTWKTKPNVINGIFTDSVAALSTNLEMENKEGDKMGMRRAKEFSEGLRKICRILTQKKLIMVCSNQVRVNTNAGMFEEKYTTPGGEAMGFYASLRLRTFNASKIYKEITYKGKQIKRAIGVETTFEVYKSSVWKPYRTAPLRILFDYGIDDIGANLVYLKKTLGTTIYKIGDMALKKSLDESIRMVETNPILVKKLKRQVIQVWENIENEFSTNRIKKVR